ncbi:MAG: lysophospholipase [Gammaproteobacteria bacterium]|nr:lysophospholipase [Gammaproteobacteria bacterium]MYC25958.1 lysophospholipase [Gammaproteobacteria bacterium]
MPQLLKRAGKVFGKIYLLVCVVLWGIQGLVIFRPYSYEDIMPARTSVEYELVVDEKRGIKSRGYIVRENASGPVILFFGGRAGDALGYTHALDRMKVPVVLPNYRGHGRSDGRPSERTALADAKITLQMVRERFPDRPIVLMGDSIGCAVAISIADSNIAGMILASPFRSLAHVANRSVLRAFPLGLLMRHNFDSRSKLDSLPDKVQVIYSKDDEIIFAKETESVLEKIPQADVVIDEGRHYYVFSNNLYQMKRWLIENFDDIEPNPPVLVD